MVFLFRIYKLKNELPILYNNIQLFFSVYRAFDADSDGFVNMEEWVQGLSVFLRGSLEQQTQCKLEVYAFHCDILFKNGLYALYD